MDITDINGCTTSANGSVVTEPDTLGATSVDIDAACFGGSDGSVDLTPTGGLAPYQYSWSNGSTSEDVFGLSADSYTVTFVDQNSCVYEYTTTIDEAAEFNSTITAGGPTQFCIGDSVVLTAGPGVSYHWSSSDTTQSITVYASGSFNVEVTDLNGCEGTSALTTIGVYPTPDANILASDVTEFCSGDSVVLTGIGGQSYVWSTGSTENPIVIHNSGSYYVVAYNQFGCADTSSTTAVLVNEPPSVAIYPGGPLEFCDGGSVDLVAGGADNYQWSTGTAGPMITVTTSGPYTVTGTNANGCSAESDVVEVTVYPDAEPTITANGPTMFCEGDSVILTSSEADSYLWSTNATSQSITVFTSGNHVVEVVDSNGCEGMSAEISVEVLDNPEPTLSLSGLSVFCTGDSVTLTSSTAESYLWSTSDTVQSITVYATGTYAVEVTDTNGCMGVSDSVDITAYQNPEPMITPDGGTVFCEGEQVVLTSTPAISYLWNTSAGSPSITVTEAGLYTVTVTDTSGCTGETSIEVTVNPLPEVTVEADDPTTVCEGDTVTLNAIGDGPFVWNTEDTTQSIEVVSAGDYWVTVIDTASGCEATSNVVTVDYHPDFVPEIVADGPTPFCDGDTVVLTASPGVSYHWSSSDTTQSITVYASGSFDVEVTNLNGCESTSALMTIGVYPTPNANILASGVTEFCSGDSVVLTGIGGQSYVWSTGSTENPIVLHDSGSYYVVAYNQFGCADTSSTTAVLVNEPPSVAIYPGGPLEFCDGGSVDLVAGGADNYQWSTDTAGPMITVTTSGPYTVTGTNANGCSAESDVVEVTVYPDAEPTITANGPTMFCEGDSVILTSSEADSYLWSTNATSQSITVFTSGNHVVEVVDSNGCEGMSAEISVEVLDNPEPTLSLSGLSVFCTGDSVTLTSSTAESYLWSTSDTVQSITVYATGTYAVEVTDTNGCMGVSDSVDITAYQNPEPMITPDGGTVFCEGEVVELTASEGASYLWSTSDTTQSISVSEAGSYSVTVTNFAGCSDSSDAVIVEVFPVPTANAGDDRIVCVGDTVYLSATGGDNYTWTPGGTGASIEVSPLDDSMYIVEVTIDGCDQVATDTVWVITEEYPNAAFGYGETNLGEHVEFTDSSTTQPLFSWDWDFGDGNGSNEQNPSHDYEGSGEHTVTLIVGTENGCTDTVSEVLLMEEFFIISNVLTPNGDYINDYVWIASSLADLIEAKVYNRWGLSVWEGVGKDLRFAGKTNEGLDLSAGTYYYVIRLDYGEGGSKELTGYITLIR